MRVIETEGISARAYALREGLAIHALYQWRHSVKDSTPTGQGSRINQRFDLTAYSCGGIIAGRQLASSLDADFAGFVLAE